MPIDAQLEHMIEVWFLVLGILRGVEGKFPNDVSGPTAAPETSLGNLPCTLSKSPKRKISIRSTVKV
jgi:hypothetical protein